MGAFAPIRKQKHTMNKTLYYFVLSQSVNNIGKQIHYSVVYVLTKPHIRKTKQLSILAYTLSATQKYEKTTHCITIYALKK